MQITIAAQTLLFLRALALGGVMGLVYDLFRTLRRAVRHGWLLVLLEDVLFFLLCILMLSGLLMQQGGEVRLFVIMGALLGWVIYFFTLGVLVMRITSAMLRLLSWCGNVIAQPLLQMVTWCKKVINNAKVPLIKQKNRLKSQLCMLYNRCIRVPVATVVAGGRDRWRSKGKKKKKRAPRSTR